MENIYKDKTASLLSSWPVNPRGPQLILPKPQPQPQQLSSLQGRPCGFAFDYDDLPKLVAVHSLPSSPNEVRTQLEKATVYPHVNISPSTQQTLPYIINVCSATKSLDSRCGDSSKAPVSSGSSPSQATIERESHGEPSMSSPSHATMETELAESESSLPSPAHSTVEIVEAQNSEASLASPVQATESQETEALLPAPAGLDELESEDHETSLEYPAQTTLETEKQNNETSLPYQAQSTEELESEDHETSLEYPAQTTVQAETQNNKTPLSSQAQAADKQESRDDERGVQSPCNASVEDTKVNDGPLDRKSPTLAELEMEPSESSENQNTLTDTNTEFPYEELAKRKLKESFSMKEMGKILRTVKKTILRIQELRKDFHEEQTERRKRTILSQIIEQREQLKGLREDLLKCGQCEKRTPSAAMVTTNGDNGVAMETDIESGDRRHVAKVTDNEAPSNGGAMETDIVHSDMLQKTNTERVTELNCASNREKLEYSISTPAEDSGMVTKTTAHESVKSLQQKYPHINFLEPTLNIFDKIKLMHRRKTRNTENQDDDIVAKKPKTLEKEFSVRNNQVEETPELRQSSETCTERIEDKKLESNDEWTMELDKSTSKVIFKRRWKRFGGPFDMEYGKTSPAGYTPPSKKTFLENDYEGNVFKEAEGEDSRGSHEEDHDLLYQKTPQAFIVADRKITQNSDQGNQHQKAESSCQKTKKRWKIVGGPFDKEEAVENFFADEVAETRELDHHEVKSTQSEATCCTTIESAVDDEAEESILKLGRQLQLREAKINNLNQKKDKLIEDLRRIKLMSAIRNA